LIVAQYYTVLAPIIAAAAFLSTLADGLPALRLRDKLRRRLIAISLIGA
jgi:hypothetical protein